MWNLRSDIDFFSIMTNQKLPDYTHITANIQRLRGNVKFPEDEEEPTTTPQWAKKAQADWTHDNQYQLSPYWYHANNYKHAWIHWTGCVHDFCPTHWQAKQGSDWNPTSVPGYPKCNWLWSECTNVGCARHLWDKRTAIHFLGRDSLREVVDMQTTRVIRSKNNVQQVYN